MQAQLRGVEGKETDSLRKRTTAMQDSIKAIREFISGKTSDRQGLSRSSDITVLSSIQTAQSYIMSKSVAPSAQEEALVKNAESMIAAAVKRVNSFHDSLWKAYRQQAEATKVPLFKEYQPIQIQ
jgi:hypothetical protein